MAAKACSLLSRLVWNARKMRRSCALESSIYLRAVMPTLEMSGAKIFAKYRQHPVAASIITKRSSGDGEQPPPDDEQPPPDDEQPLPGDE